MFLGKHLLVLLEFESNGTADAFGVVTRVWSDEAVNLVFFPDASAPIVGLSVPVVGDRDAAITKQQAGHHGPVAYHPPRAA